jgi:NAD(P)H-flavin reductase
MDTNHRGGSPGFVRILSNDESGLTLVYPEFSGNRLYQTLGNLNTSPQAGLVFPDFDTGNVLYVTGKTEILIGKAATDLIGHTNLAVKIQVEAARYVLDGLAFRGQKGEYSPYNPPVRYLSSENRHGISSDTQVTAKLVDKKIITPSVARFKFHITNPEKASQWKPGQYVALSFQDELDIGYSHMRDDDPKSLNDDFLRTFTVSSRQDALPGEFEITIRKVGPVTEHLFRHNVRAELEVPLQGFGGEFFLQQGEGEKISYIAGGVGITPLLAQAQDLDLKRLQLYWTIKGGDVALANDTFKRVPGLAASTKLFITGKVNEDSTEWKKIVASGPVLEKRRIFKDDISGDPATRWYLCTGPGLRTTLLGWLEGKTALYEDFNY